MSSYRPVDPLTGKSIGLGNYTPSAGLQKRLAEQVQRKTAEGTFTTLPDGSKKFTPKFVEEAASHAVTAPTTAEQVREHNAKVLERMRAIKHASGFNVGDRVTVFGGAEYMVARSISRMDAEWIAANGTHVTAVYETPDFVQIHAPTCKWLISTSRLRHASPTECVLLLGDRVEKVDGLLQGHRGKVHGILSATGQFLVAMDNGGGAVCERASLRLIAKA